MTSFLSSYVIDPVLRQAHRFSQPNLIDEQDAPELNGVSSAHTAVDVDPLIDEEFEPVESMESRRLRRDGSLIERPVLTLGNTQPATPATILEGSMVESPATEDGGLQSQLETFQGRNTQASLNSYRQRSYPRQTSSQRRRSSQFDGETTGNPSYGIPDRFAASDLVMTPSYTNLASAEVDGIVSPAEGHSRQNTGQSASRQSISSHRARNGSLPADDGMSRTRRRIIEIREMDISGFEKARLMHELMTEQYQSSQHIPNLQIPHANFPVSSQNQDRPLTPTSSTAGPTPTSHGPLTPTSMSSHGGDGEEGFNLTAEDLNPTFIPRVVPQASSGSDPESSRDSEYSEEEGPKLGCKHYKRNVKLQCSTCRRWYTCRFCHDESEAHTLNRKETKNMLCMLCGCAQQAGENCIDCGVRGGYYFCGVCKLWDDDSEKSIYHCNDCGICRVGRGLGKDYFHCKTCGVCMSISIATSHRCIERSTECDCPICGEYMFTSPETVVFMLCGHSIHHKCYYAHMKASYRCPICSRSIVNMETQFRNMDRAIESQPMPAQFEDTKALVYCNDCYAKSSVKYHWLGLKCGVCSSYNTAQLQILSGPEPESLPAPNSEGLLRGVDVGELVVPSIPEHRPSIPSTRRNSTSISTPVVEPSSSVHDVSSRQPQNQPDLLIEGNQSTATRLNIEDEDEEDEDEVDFWGGESPRERRISALQREEAMNEAEDEEGSSDEDHDMNVDDDDDGDDPDDQMDIFGHR